MRGSRLVVALAVAAGLVAVPSSAENAGVQLGGCTFPFRGGPEVLNVLLPDRGAYYYGQAFTYLPGTTLVIRGEFPHARYMNFVVYDAAGLPIASIADFEIEPEPGSTNPFRRGAARDAQDRSYVVRVRFAPRPASGAEPNTLYVYENRAAGPVRFADAGGQIFYRVYDPDEGVGPEGGVFVPTVATQADGVEGPTVAPFQRADCQQARDVRAPVGIDDTMRAQSFPSAARRGSGGTTASWAATAGTGTFPIINPDNTYLRATPTLTSGDVLVVRGRAPTFANTSSAAIMPPDDPDAAPLQVRYWSFCTYDLGTRVVDCLADRQIELEADGTYEIVISPADARPQGARNWITWPVTPAMLLLYRQLLADPGYSQSIKSCSASSSQPLATCMGAYWPVATYCTLATFEAKACPAG